MKNYITRISPYLSNSIGHNIKMQQESPLKEAKEFDPEDFRTREEFRLSYIELCDAIDMILDFQTVLDIGSANGFVIDALVPKGKDVTGVEKSNAVSPLLSGIASQRAIFADILGQSKIGDFDLITCIEVAEHIPPPQWGYYRRDRRKCKKMGLLHHCDPLSRRNRPY